jgi:membrane protease YdiL (CAAX protease family)
MNITQGTRRDQAPGAPTLTSPDMRAVVLLAPVVLILASFVILQLSQSTTTGRVAQLTAFSFYWIACGIIIPLIILGRSGYAALFNRPRVRWTTPLRIGVAALFVPAAFGFLFAFPYLFPAESYLLLPGVALYALLNGTFEEAFWRGLFIRQFPANRWLAVVYPGVMFGFWQLVPWTLFDSWLRPPAIAVFAIAMAIGLLYGWVAWRCGSVRWTAMAHVLMNLSGVGAFLVFAPG